MHLRKTWSYRNSWLLKRFIIKVTHVRRFRWLIGTLWLLWGKTFASRLKKNKISRPIYGLLWNSNFEIYDISHILCESDLFKNDSIQFQRNVSSMLFLIYLLYLFTQVGWASEEFSWQNERFDKVEMTNVWFRSQMKVENSLDNFLMVQLVLFDSQ